MRSSDWLLPDGSVASWSDERLRRARVLIASVLVFLTAVVGQSLINLARGYYVGVVQFLPFVAVAVAAMWLIKRRGLVIAALHLFLAAFTVTLVILILVKRGMGATPPLAATILAPVLATLVAGSRVGASWMGIIVALVLGLFVMDHYGLVTTDELAGTTRDVGDTVMMLLIGTLLFGLIMAFHVERHQAVKGMVEREAKLRRVEVERVQALASAHVAESERLAAMGQLAAATAHEINNPLSYVINNLEHIDAQLREHDEGLREALAEAIEGAQRVEAIVKGLQTFTRNDEGLGLVDVEDVLNAALKLTEAQTRHRATIERNVAPLEKIWANEGALVQVFTNLLLNAAQALPESHKSDHVISVKAYERDGHCVVEVTDTGPGIPRDIVDKIFDPFFTTKPIGKGTGLGLAVCINIVRSHEGSIEYERRTPGARFTVTLPRRLELVPEPSPHPVVQAGEQAAHLRLLIVDDDVLVAKAMARALSGHDVTVTHSGPEAIALLRGGNTYDVILSDLMMPDFTGMDLHELVRRDYPDLLTRLIFMTGGAFTPHARAFESEVDAPFIAKPIDIAELRQLLTERAAQSTDQIPQTARPARALNASHSS